MPECGVRCAWTIWIALSLAACGGATSADSGSPDAGTDASSSDGGSESAVDGGSMDASDAGSVLDAPLGLDATPDADATVAMDAAVDMDATVAMDAADDATMDAALDDGSLDAFVGDGSVWSSFTTTFPSAPPIAPATSCVVTRGDTISTSAAHVPNCSDVTTWETTPPCHGDHYGNWADFKTYDAPVPWGFLVHAMEHGAVVFAYSCGASCAAALQAFIDGYPADPLCTGASRDRFILAPDPTLTVPIAIASWTHLYTATCIDLPSIQSFVDGTYAMAPENFCFPGADFSTADGGWCPPTVDAGTD